MEKLALGERASSKASEVIGLACGCRTDTCGEGRDVGRIVDGQGIGTFERAYRA